MVDMRGDGEVDSNGWQYSHAFSSSTWRSHVKSFNRGGWVRRRRWVRLMTKPATIKHLSEERQRSPKQVTYDANVVWKGDSDDWLRCRQALKDSASDSQRLELWRTWFSNETVTTVLQSTVTLRVSSLSLTSYEILN
jgi:hypothetical protein